MESTTALIDEFHVTVAFRAQAGLDFEPLLTTLVENLSLSAAGAEAVLSALLRFLTIKAVLADVNATRYSPCVIVDHAWHTLILDTKLYAAVCDALRGEMLHHDPSGSRAINNAQRAERRGNTIAAHEVLFGCAETTEFHESSKKRKAPEASKQPAAAGFALTVKSLNGRTAAMAWPGKTAASVTVWELAKEYESIEGVPVDQSRFILNGKALPRMDLHRSDDDTERDLEERKAACVAVMKATTLESEGVVHNAKLHAVNALVGC